MAGLIDATANPVGSRALLKVTKAFPLCGVDVVLVPLTTIAGSSGGEVSDTVRPTFDNDATEDPGANANPRWPVGAFENVVKVVSGRLADTLEPTETSDRSRVGGFDCVAADHRGVGYTVASML